MDEAAAGARASRRNALKAAAAAGVGVVALGGPQVGVMGAAPAYAVGSSQSGQLTQTGSVNCGGNPNDCGGNIRLNQGGGQNTLMVGPVTVGLANLNNVCTSDPLVLTFTEGATTYANAAAAGVSCSAVVSVSGGPQNVAIPGNVPKFIAGTNGTAGYCNGNWTLTLTCVGTD